MHLRFCAQKCSRKHLPMAFLFLTASFHNYFPFFLLIVEWNNLDFSITAQVTVRYYGGGRVNGPKVFLNSFLLYKSLPYF